MMRPLCCIVLSAGKCTFDNAAMQTRLITHSSASPKPDVVSHLPYTVTVDINECIQGHCAKQAEAENRMRKSEKQNCQNSQKTRLVFFVFFYSCIYFIIQSVSDVVNVLTYNYRPWFSRFARVFQHVWEEEETAGDLRPV